MRVVVKWGGRLSCDPGHLAADVARLSDDAQVAVCHGGSTDIDEVTATLGVPMEHLVAPDGTSTRKTSVEVLDSLQMALRGRTQRRIVEALARHGLRAVGLQGGDAGAVLTRWKTPIRTVEEGRTRLVRDNYGGRVTSVDPELYEVLLDRGMVPVICPPAVTADGVVTNVDADRLAARVAAALDASVLCLLTDQPGLLQDPEDPGSVVSSLTPEEARTMSGQVSGGMRLKLVAAAEALEHGVSRVVLADGRREHPITDGLNGLGTTITKEDA